MEFLLVTTTDQENITDNINNTIGTKISYTEPLKKDFYMELTYGFTYINNKNDRLTNIKTSMANMRRWLIH
jgi:hypothetical protein